MKKFIAIFVLMLGLVSFAGATVVAPALQHTQKVEFVKKDRTHTSVVKGIKNIIPANTKASIGQNALIGVLLIVLGALLFIPQLVTIIAATLIIMGVVLFVLDLIGMI